MRAQVATAVVPTLLALALVSRPTAAQVDPWGSQIFPDPLRFNSLPLEPSQAVVPPAGEWQISAASGYFNVWQTTWHTGATHRDPALVGKPLTEAELRLLETNFPHDQFYFIDVEGWREDLSASVGLGDGYALTGRVPWIHIGGPVWDTIAEDFHRIFGLSDQRRNLFSHGQTVVYARGNHGKIEHWAEENGSGLGDSSLAVTGPLGHWLGADHRWVAALQVPTGEAGTLRGSGGWDAGLRWFGTWGGERRQVRFGLGYTWLDPNGSWLGVKRDNTWHALAEAHVPLGALTLRYSLRFDSSPLASFTDSVLGMPSSYWMLGVLGRLPHSAWWAFDLGEKYPSSADVPDFSFHLLFGTRLGRR
ncbi:MAG: DUF3187 family protein [Thermoanaerobaculales bacterium]